MLAATPAPIVPAFRTRGYNTGAVPRNAAALRRLAGAPSLRRLALRANTVVRALGVEGDATHKAYPRLYLGCGPRRLEFQRILSFGLLRPVIRCFQFHAYASPGSGPVLQPRLLGGGAIRFGLLLRSRRGTELTVRCPLFVAEGDAPLGQIIRCHLDIDLVAG